MKIHTSQSLKDHYQLVDGEQYLLTDSEADWLFNWVRPVLGKYAIADHLIKNIEKTLTPLKELINTGKEEIRYIYTIDTIGLGEALKADRIFPRVVPRHYTWLQAIMFYSACEPA